MADNYILIFFYGMVLLVLYRKCQQNQKFSRLRFLIGPALIAYCVYNLLLTYQIDNNLKFLNITNISTEEEINAALKATLAHFHPDQPEGDNEKFLRASELKEIYTSPKGKSFFEIHQVFGVDPRDIFYDKFSSKNFKTFHLEVFNNFAFNGFAILLIHVLMFESISESNWALGGFGFLFALGIILEGIIFDHPLFSTFYEPVIKYITQWTHGSQITVVQMIALTKIFFATVGFFLAMVWLEIKSLYPKRRFNELWESVQKGLKNPSFKPEEMASDIHLFSEKVDKRTKSFQKEMKMVKWTLIGAPFGILVNYLGQIGAFQMWVMETFGMKDQQ